MICPSCGKERTYFVGNICAACDRAIKSCRGVISRNYVRKVRGLEIPFKGALRYSINTKKKNVSI